MNINKYNFLHKYQNHRYFEDEKRKKKACTKKKKAAPIPPLLKHKVKKQ